MSTVLAGTGTGNNREIWRQETVSFYNGKPGENGTRKMSYDDMVEALDEGIIWENPIWKIEAMGHQEHTLTDNLTNYMKTINEKIPPTVLKDASIKAAKNHEPETVEYWLAMKMILDEQGYNWYSPKDLAPWPASRS